MTTMTSTCRPATELRLTRRGRLVVLGLALTVLFLCGIAWAAGSVATAEKGTPPRLDLVTVGTGDTLWKLAAARADSGDVQAMVDKILALNDLDSAAVDAGDQILVPAE